MKRLLYVLTLSLLFVVLTGCAKDEVTPHNGEENDSEAEVASHEDVKQYDEQESNESADKEENEADTEQSNKKAEADKAGDTDKEDKSDSEKANESNETKKNVNVTKKADTSKNSSKDTTEKGSEKQTKQTAEKSKGSPKKDTKPGKPITEQTNKKKDEQSSPKPVEKPKEPEKTVTVSITTGDVKGTILSPTKVPLQDGDTVLEATLRILKEKGIQYSVQGSKASAYVKGIDNLYEFDEGQNSGWMITVDGALIDRGAGAYSVSNGQTIRWGYTRDYIENPLGGM